MKTIMITLLITNLILSFGLWESADSEDWLQEKIIDQQRTIQELKEKYGELPNRSGPTSQEERHCSTTKEIAWEWREVSAYNVGDPNQCDDTPCETANGENICEALKNGYKRVALNYLPFGSIIEIEGMGEFLVSDRMNSRYPSNVDIAFKLEEKQEAKNIGRRMRRVRTKRIGYEK